MGKDQKKRAIRHRHNPIRVPDSHLAPGLAAASASANEDKRNAVLPIIQKLGSTDAADRVWAAAAVSNLINNDPSTRRLLQGKNVVRILIDRLSDSVEEVVVEASGALRNLAIDGGYDICGEMFNKGILEPLKVLIPKISSSFQQHLASPPTQPAADSMSLVFALTENTITLFWCLSETSNKALNSINNLGLVPFLMALIQNRERFSAKLVVAAAHCLYVLTDDNVPTITALQADSASISSLLTIARSSPESFTFVGASSSNTNANAENIDALRVLACGILRNISPLPTSSSTATSKNVEEINENLTTSIILPLFLPLLSIDLSALSSRAYALATSASQGNGLAVEGGKHLPGNDHLTPVEKELAGIERRLSTLGMCLDILVEVCASLPEIEDAPGAEEEEEGGAEEEEGDDDDEEMDEDADAQMDADADGDVSNKAPAIPESTQSHTPTSLLQTLTPPLLSLARPTPNLSFPPPALPSVHPPTTSALGNIHVRAMECLNNLFVGMKERDVLGAGAEEDDVEKERVRGAIGVWDEMWSAGLLGAVGAPSELSSVNVGESGEGGKRGLERLFGPGQERRVEMWTIGVGVLWGLGRMSRGVLTPNEDQARILMTLCDHAGSDSDSDESTQVQVRCIGTLGCMAQCQRPEAGVVEANLMITRYLLNVLVSGTAPSTSTRKTYAPEPTFHAIASLIDIFSDESSPYDANFRIAKVLSGMNDSLRGARRLIKTLGGGGAKGKVAGGGGRGAEGRAVKAWAEGVVGDFGAFVQYRRKLGR